MIVAVHTASEAVDLLRYCLGDGGTVTPTKHFRDELAKEGLSFPDAWYVLKTGTIYNPAEPDIKTGEWKYQIEGHAPDGKWLQIVFCFRAVDSAVLITVFSVEEKRRTP